MTEKLIENTAAYIGLTNPKGPSNVGSVMRAAGCFGVREIRYNGDRFDYASKFNTDTKNMASTIPLKKVEGLADGLSSDVKVICVDLIEGAVPLPDFKHPEKAIYIFGPEDGTVSQAVIDNADAAVYIPTTGCLNLAATVNVVLYDRLAKSDCIDVGDELIKASRDTNNRVKVKAGR